jgi:hypothetical protein
LLQLLDLAFELRAVTLELGVFNGLLADYLFEFSGSFSFLFDGGFVLCDNSGVLLTQFTGFLGNCLLDGGFDVLL